MVEITMYNLHRTLRISVSHCFRSTRRHRRGKLLASQGHRNRVGQGARAPHILADQISPSQPGGQTMPTTLIFTPLNFQTFLRPCLGVMLCLLISTAWARRRQPNYIYLLTDYRCLLFASPISTTCKGYLNSKLYRVFKLDLHQNKRLLGHQKCTFKS